MDTTEEDLQSEQLGVMFEDILVCCLLLMDDAILIAPSPLILQKMLNVVDRVALRWHLTFNQKKSKVMLVNAPPSPNHHQWSLGDIILDECSSYTYLGEIITSLLKLQDHIQHVKQRSFWISNTIFSIASDQTLGMLKMTTLLHLYIACWLPAVLYNCETWTMSKSEAVNLEHIQLTLLRRILKVPSSTPKAAIYGDLGIQPLKHQIHRRQLVFFHKLLCSSHLVNLALINQFNHPYQDSWLSKEIKPLLHQYKLPSSTDQICSYSKNKWKRLVKNAIQRKFETWFREEAARSSKMLRATRFKPKPNRESYVQQLTRNQVAAIFRLRYAMSTADANFTTGSPVCRKCNQGVATDHHILTRCPAFQSLRDELQIQGLQPIYQADDPQTLRRYAIFVERADLMPKWQQ